MRARLISQQVLIEERIIRLTENYHSERNHRQVPKGWMPMEDSALIKDLQVEVSASENLLKTINLKIIELTGGAK